MNPYALLIGTVVFILAIAGTGWKAYQLGGDRKQVEWDKANVAAALAVEQDRKSQEQKARKAASRYEAKIATQTLTNREIASALDKALAVKPLPPECVVSDGVRDAINAALAGQGIPAGVLPSTSQPPADAAKPVR